MGFHEIHSGVEVILLSRSKERSLRRDLNMYSSERGGKSIENQEQYVQKQVQTEHGNQHAFGFKAGSWPASPGSWLEMQNLKFHPSST